MDNVVIVTSDGFLRVAKIFDAYWLEADTLPDPRSIVRQLKEVDTPPDLFMFTQRAPETDPKFDLYHEWDNVAAIPISTHENWFQNQVSPGVRRNIRTSQKKGVTVRVCPFDETFIRGVMAVSDESMVRAGRKFWHYGKDFETVEADHGTYRDRSTYLGAFVGDQMVGFMKIVFDTHSAAIMQIVSTMQSRDRRPNNALLSEGVRICAERGVGYLLYERLVYGNKTDSSLTRFKRENGFVKMDLPCYYVPLTIKGRVALGLGFHRNWKDRVPQWLTAQLIALRDKWNARQLANPGQ